eukprot:scaffold1277_cov253-Pinguiococcus_pyrenoidosus.AAC.56
MATVERPASRTKHRGLSARPINVLDGSPADLSPVKKRVLHHSASTRRKKLESPGRNLQGFFADGGATGSPRRPSHPVPEDADDSKSEGSMEMDVDVPVTAETAIASAAAAAAAATAATTGSQPGATPATRPRTAVKSVHFAEEDDADDDDTLFRVDLRTVKLLEDEQEAASRTEGRLSVNSSAKQPPRARTDVALMQGDEAKTKTKAEAAPPRPKLFTPNVRKARAALPRSRSKIGGPRRIVKGEGESEGENDGRSSSSGAAGVEVGDLSYIKNWDPDTWRRRDAAGPASSSLSETGSQLPPSNPYGSLSPLVEESAEAEGDDTLAAGARAAPRPQSDHHVAANPPEDVFAFGTSTGSSSNHLSTHSMSTASSSSSTTSSVRSSSAAPASRQHPLGTRGQGPDEICVVNGKSFVKLGIVGKGGSSQVYRVMDSAHNVFALKKVNIDSQTDRRMVEMYKNEITLLEKLRGNPRIVELVDSQVDTEAHCIQLLMEMGETDLSKLLETQKAAAERSSPGVAGKTNGPAGRSGADDWQATLPSGLSHNFVRLLWQQMLEAVDAIHEEHIVHGDLKPANFLLVKVRLAQPSALLPAQPSPFNAGLLTLVVAVYCRCRER